MAKMHPPRFPYPKEPRRRAEAQFFRACDEQLSDDWTVLFEQHWHGHRNGQQQRGEADFVMFHPMFGVFVVEVKGGQEIGVDNGEWYTVPRGSSTRERVKNPFTQAADSKSVLWDWLRERVPSLRLKGELGHMVVFPGHRQEGDMSAQARRSLICDREDLQHLDKTMRRVSQYFGQKTKWTDDDISRAVSLLMPSFHLVGSNRGEYDEFFNQLNQLTEMQLTAFAMLRRQSRLNIHGGAGTGKTVLAFHRARELSAEGKEVLYLCHSSPLAEFLRTEAVASTNDVIGKLTIKSAAEFIFPHVRSVDGIHEQRTQKELLHENCLSSALFGVNLVDALIVDEAQSIEAWIVEGAQLLLKDDGYQYIFGDINQTTIHRKWQSHSEHLKEIERAVERGESFTSINDPESSLHRFGSDSPIVLNVNCRSSTQIADFAHRIVNTDTDCLGSSFAEVAVVGCEIEDLGTQVATVVATWVDEYGLSAEDIRILVPSLKIHHDSTFFREMFAGELCATISNGVIIDWLNASDDFAELLAYQAVFELYQQFCEQCAPVSPEVRQRRMDFLAWCSQINERPNEKVEPRTQERVTPLDDEGSELQSDEVHLKTLIAQISRIDALKEIGLPQYRCVPYDQFIGLEAQAIIAVLPMGNASTDNSAGTHGFEREFFTIQAYTMATRARALLTVIGDAESIAMLNACLEFWGPSESS
jgi:hypothetical protein